MQKKYFILILLILSLWFFVLSCSRSGEQKPLVTIDGQSVSPDDLTGMVPDDMWDILSENEKKEMLSRLIDRELLAMEARKRGMDEEPVVAARIRATERDILANMVEENLLQNDIKVTAREIKEFYRKNPVLFVRNEDEARLYKLSFPDKETADSALVLLKATDDTIGVDDFRNVAVSFQLDTSEIDLDYIPIEGLFNSLEKKVQTASAGELIGPLSSGPDYSIFQVQDIGRAGTIRPLEYVEKEIENLIYIQKSQERRQAFTDSLREYYQPVIEPTVWDSLLHR